MMKYPCQDYAKESIQTTHSPHKDNKFVQFGVCKASDFCVKLITDDKVAREEDKEFIVIKICEHSCKHYERNVEGIK